MIELQEIFGKPIAVEGFDFPVDTLREFAQPGARPDAEPEPDADTLDIAMLKAIDEMRDGLPAAYAAAKYTVKGVDGDVSLTVGRRSREMDRLLAGHGVTFAGLITPDNPHSVIQSRGSNDAFRRQFCSAVSGLMVKSVGFDGTSRDGSWPVERGGVLFGLDQSQSRKLAKLFGQDAFLFVEAGKPVSLVMTKNSRLDPRDGDGDGYIFDGTPEERPTVVRSDNKYTPDKLNKALAAWVAEHGMDPDAKWTKEKGYHELPDRELIEGIAQEQQDSVGVDEAALESYDSFRDEMVSQYRMLQSTGLKVYEWQGEGDPYKVSAEKPWVPSSKRMREEVTRTGEFNFFMTEKGFGGDGAAKASLHPLLAMSPVTTSDGKPMLYNDVFRVVHDSVAHLHGGFTFSTRGEMNGMLSHASTLSKKSRQALFTETFAQNAVYDVTGKFAEQNVYRSKFDGYIEELLAISAGDSSQLVTKSLTDLVSGSSDDAGYEEDGPIGAGRLRRQPGACAGESGLRLAKAFTKAIDDIRDGDGDGYIHDGTPEERAVAVDTDDVEQINERLEDASLMSGRDELDIVDDMIRAKVTSRADQIAFLDRVIRLSERMPALWEPDDLLNPSYFERFDGETDAEADQRLASWQTRWSTRQMFRDMLRGTTRLSNTQKGEYLENIQHTLDNMGSKALEAVERHVNGVLWYKNTTQLSNSMKASSPELRNMPGLLGGAWGPSSTTEPNGLLYLDGDRLSSTKKGIYAHEFGHVIDWQDGAKPGRISDTSEWQTAYQDELKDKQLSDYGATHRSEGFAEFARLIYSEHSNGEAKKSFPKCYAVFQQNGYL